MRIAATLIAVIAVMYLAREILIPLAFAVTLALVLSPAVGWLQKIHIRRFAAAEKWSPTMLAIDVDPVTLL